MQSQSESLSPIIIITLAWISLLPSEFAIADKIVQFAFSCASFCVCLTKDKVTAAL